MTEYNKNKPDSIQAMFGSIATQYDRTNAILSFQMHHYWNRQLIKLLKYNNTQILADLCCGTGEIGLGFLKTCQSPKKAYMIDFCAEMLQCAKSKSSRLGNHEIEFIQADVQLIPLKNASVDAVSIAYGIRNVKNPSKCISEVYRILKPEGKFGILELTRPNNSFLKLGHKIYLTRILPIVGKLVTSNENAYKYLCSSIENFSKPSELEQIMSSAGFREIRIQPLLGGIATIISGKK